MGFQGDVAGIGLGELLQGLARGGREGVLTLRGGSNGSTLGLQEGQLFLLPEPDEDPEIWRRRCERAWVKDPNERIDILRMSEIAYAARLEGMFQLLDSEGVHFRFEPGPLPDPDTPPEAVNEVEELALGRAETGSKKVEIRVPVHCPGLSVEYLLLEYARLSDEGQTHGDASRISVHDVPRLLTPEAPSPEMERFWEECDGMSNLIEIADRLGWPIRQCQAISQQLFASNFLRLADERELLVLAQKELAQNRFARAASRLSGWVVKSEPGPSPVGDAQLLISEWNKGKLPAMIASMDAREARTLLRRLELVEGDVHASVQRWKKLREFHRHDPIAELRQLQWQLRSEDEGDAPALADLLKVARKFQDLGHNMRAGVVLRGAAEQMPETTSVRLELGQRLLAVGLVEEGAPWVLEACRTLIESSLAEKAVGPLRGLLGADPGNREARAMLGAARKTSLSGKLYRRNSIVALAVLLVLSMVALVKVQIDQDIDRKLNQVESMMDQPQAALDLLQKDFDDDSSARVQELRDGLFKLLLDAEGLARQSWLDAYDKSRLECTLGDPVAGLKRALQTPPPPELRYLPTQDWPTVEELLDSLAGRLEQAVAEWGPAAQNTPDQLHSEQRLATLIGDLVDAGGEGETTRDIENFVMRLGVLSDALEQRGEYRAEERRRILEQQTLEKQNFLLGAARSHYIAGDLDRAVSSFEELISMDGSEALARVLEEEIAIARDHRDAVEYARRLSFEGDHTAAWEALHGPCPDPTEHLLPWKVETWPEGARVRLSDGTERMTPFVFESTFGEDVTLEVELAGHEPLTYSIEDPGDLMLPLSRLADRWWNTESPVEALPVAVGDDHVCCDRAGRIVRLPRSSEPLWEFEIDTLGGIARTPVFLPRRGGFLLTLTEDGEAWLVDASSGRREGPWRSGLPPTKGPVATTGGVVAAFRDGSMATWEEDLEPKVTPTQFEAFESTEGADAGLSVLRRSASQGRTLSSPWSPYVAETYDDHYLIRWEGRESATFSVRRTGDWEFVAWEAPNAKIPGGRLWISDGAGLRAFEP